MLSKAETWNDSGWNGFIGAISTSTNDIKTEQNRNFYLRLRAQM